MILLRSAGLIVMLFGMIAINLANALADDIDRVRELRSSESILPLSSILESIKIRYPDSTLLDAELEEEHGQIVYEIKIVDQSHHIHKLEFDAKTGKKFVEGGH